MRSDMKIALMEKHSPTLLKELNIGNCEVLVKRKNGIGRKVLIVKSDVLYKLEEKGMELLDEGHEVIKPIWVRGTKYCMIMTVETNPNSIHLQIKKLQENI